MRLLWDGGVTVVGPAWGQPKAGSVMTRPAPGKGFQKELLQSDGGGGGGVRGPPVQ